MTANMIGIGWPSQRWEQVCENGNYLRHLIEGGQQLQHTGLTGYHMGSHEHTHVAGPQCAIGIQIDAVSCVNYGVGRVHPRSAYLEQWAAAALWPTLIGTPNQHHTGAGERGQAAHHSRKCCSHTAVCERSPPFVHGYLRHKPHPTMDAQAVSASVSRCMGCGSCTHAAGLMEQQPAVLHMLDPQRHGGRHCAMDAGRQRGGCAAVGKGPATHAVRHLGRSAPVDCMCQGSFEYGQQAMNLAAENVQRPATQRMGVAAAHGP
jgi:hypothetical protein